MPVKLPTAGETASPCSACRSAGQAADRAADQTGDRFVDRRQFLGAASMLSLGALMAACGDGVFDGPEAFLDLIAEPIRVVPSNYPELSLIGGRAIITPVGRSPMVVEKTGLQTYRAFSLTCPHKGTIIAPTAGGYECPNHGARFAKDGQWIGGQDTVDLTPVAISVQSDGTLLVGGVVIPPPPPRLRVAPETLFYTASVGGSNPQPQDISIENTGAGLLSGLSIAIEYSDLQPTGWLAASLSKLNAPATLTLSVSRGTLSAGTYTAYARVSSNVAMNGPQVVIVTLVVIGTNTPPALRLSLGTLALSTTIGKSPAPQSVQIINAGNGTIGALATTISYGAGATGWLSTSSLSSTSTPSTLTVRPATNALAVGSYTAVVTIAGAGVPAVTLSVTLDVAQDGLPVVIAEFPALANVGGVADIGQSINFVPIAVVRTGANSFIALSRICPHAGSYVNVVNAQSFRCPNHGALFNANGSLMSNSPIQTGSLSMRTVRYTPGDTVLYVT